MTRPCGEATASRRLIDGDSPGVVVGLLSAHDDGVTPAAAERAGKAGAADYRIIATIVSISLLMQFLDGTILTSALPVIARDLDVRALDMNVTLLAYQLVMAMFIPLGSALGDHFGAKRVFLVAQALFLSGSVLCALSPTLLALVGARIVQGLGGALMIPVGRVIVVRSARSFELVSAMNWLLVPAIIGPLLGPPLGGFIATYASWHGIFLINLPIGLVGMVFAMLMIPDSREVTPRPFDVAGMCLVAPMLAGFMFGLERAVGGHPLSAGLGLTVGFVLAAAYLAHARRHADPVIDLSLFRHASFRTSLLLGSLVRGTTSATTFLLPLMFQLALGMTPAKSGAITFVVSGGALGSRLASAAILRWLTVRMVLILAAIGSVSTLFAMAALRSATPPILFYLVLGSFGFFGSLIFVVAGALAYVDVAPERTGAATGLYTTVQQLTFSLGVIAAVAAAAIGAAVTHGGESEPMTYSVALGLLATVACAAVVSAIRLKPGTAETLRARG